MSPTSTGPGQADPHRVISRRRARLGSAVAGSAALDLGDLDAARIVLTPFVPPGALDGLDPERAGRDRLPTVPELFKVVDDRSVAWTVLAVRRQRGGRDSSSPSSKPAAAARGIWRDVIHVCRLDEPDPVALGEAPHRRDLAGGLPPRRSRSRRPAFRRSGHRPDGRSPPQLALCEGGRLFDHPAPASSTCRTYGRRSSTRRRIPERTQGYVA